MSRLKVKEYSFDFETVVNESRTKVWLWGSIEIESKEFKYGYTIESFFDWISKCDRNGSFHNLKFDAQFIIYNLFKLGYKHSISKNIEKGEFTTLISDTGVFYSMEICFFNGRKLRLYDSYKRIPLSVKDIPKAFGLDIEKLSIEYEKVNYDDDYVANEEDIEYVKNDCLIVALAIEHLNNQNLKKHTAPSNALFYYKSLYDKNKYDYLYPQITLMCDADCRKSYKGGWAYLNPKYKDIMVGEGSVYDVNSMYPWAMTKCSLPYGEPIYYEGKYKNDKLYPLYIQCFKAKFKLKEGMMPTIQTKHSFVFSEREYIIEAKEPEILYLTSVDYELFIDCYEISEIEYLGGYKFRGMIGMFDEYIDYWYGVKTEASINNNYALRTIAKLMLNSLYGKFGSNPLKKSKYPIFDSENDVVKYLIGAEEKTSTSYVPVASFITAYSRDKIIRAAISCGDRFVYADTDSLHILGNEVPNIEIDSVKLGAFKLESNFDCAKFHRSKCYIESISGKLEKKCAGLPTRARDLFNFETMEFGSEFDGKLVPKIVPGGCVLVNRKFTIK